MSRLESDSTEPSGPTTSLGNIVSAISDLVDGGSVLTSSQCRQRQPTKGIDSILQVSAGDTHLTLFGPLSSRLLH